MKKLLLTMMLASTALLTGCGHTTATMAPLRGDASVGNVIGVPASYQAGQPLPGADGTPSLRKVDFPVMTYTADGEKSDPVNLLVSGTERQVRHVFGAEGWLQADPINAVTSAKMFKNFLSGGSYPTAPMSDLYLYNRTQDMALEKNTPTVRSRDHLRVWQTPLKDHLGRPFWAIAATRDVAVKFGASGLSFTHQISPDIDAERAVVINDFVKSGEVAMHYTLQSLPANFKGLNGGGDEFYTDGRTVVLELVQMK